MRSYRSRLDIIADILQVAKGNAKKTQIMYQANLSYRSLQRYLNEIVEASLISLERVEQHYVLTPKGRDFIKIYKDYSEASKNIEKYFDKVCGKKKILEGMCTNK